MIKTNSKYLVYGSLVLLSSLLFFREGMGLNSLAFVSLLIAGFLLQPDHKFKKDGYAFFFIAGCLFSAIAVLLMHSALSVFSLVVFTLLFVGHQHLANHSIFIVVLNSAYSILATPFIALHEKFISVSNDAYHKPKANRSQQLAVLRMSAVVIPVAGVAIFLSLYATANPVFSKAFEWISFDGLPFTMLMAVLLAGLFFYHPLGQLNKWQATQGFHILRRRKALGDAHPLSLKFEMRTALILLSLLNVLLFFFNAADIHYLISGATQTTEFSHADFVHQGIYTLIISIVLAISIMLYYFRGNLNFFQANAPLKRLAYVWIAQNLLLALSSAYKNALYIEEFSLTYKRIGVFVYLLLVIIGLITTYQKLHQKRTIWYLLHVNSWCIIVIMLVSSYVPWDRVVTQYNLNESDKPDHAYLISLSDANIPMLLPYLESEELEEHERENLQTKIEVFQAVEEEQSFLSWNYQDQLIMQALQKQLP